MGRIVRADIEPGLLIWARESIGYSVAEAAKKIGVPTERLLAWEQGDAPTINQLRKAANVYKRPLAVFYLPEPPTDFFAVRDFRRLPEADEAEASPALNLQIRLARSRRRVALEMAGELGLDPSGPELAISLNAVPEEIGGRVRDLLSIDLQRQSEWKDPYAVLNGWVEAVEKQDVLVFQTSDVDVEEMRGFSISERPFPVIVINAKDSPRGRVFTLLHELCHVLLDAGGLCDLQEIRNEDRAEDRIEVFCNHVAGASLVPAEALLSSPLVRRHEGDDWSDADIRLLAERFGSSQEVILRRLLTIRLTTRDVYQAKRQEYLEAYERSRREQGGYAPYIRVRLRDLGRPYTSLVLNAYRQDTINSADVSDYLGVRLKHVPTLEHEVFGIGATG